MKKINNVTGQVIEKTTTKGKPKSTSQKYHIPFNKKLKYHTIRNTPEHPELECEPDTVENLGRDEGQDTVVLVRYTDGRREVADLNAVSKDIQGSVERYLAEHKWDWNEVGYIQPTKKNSK